MRRVVLSLCFVLPVSAVAGSLCSGDERILFSCKAGAKVISVCSSKDLSSQNGYVQYRFGSGEKIELEAPKNRGASRQLVSVGGETYAESTIEHMAFTAGIYEYIVYDAMFMSVPSPEAASGSVEPIAGYSGVAVYKEKGHRGKPIAIVQCTERPNREEVPAGVLKSDARVFSFPEDESRMKPWARSIK